MSADETKNAPVDGGDPMTRLHVRPTLRFAYSVDGRPDVLTRKAAYAGAVRAAIAKRCDCYEGTGQPDDLSEPCLYHLAMDGGLPELARQRDVVDRLRRIYKVEDRAALASMRRPTLDLSRMSKQDIETLQVAADWHLANGAYR